MVRAGVDGRRYVELLAGPYKSQAGTDRFVCDVPMSDEVSTIYVVQSIGTWQDAAIRADEVMLAPKNMTLEERQSRMVHEVEDEEDGDEDDGDKQS